MTTPNPLIDGMMRVARLAAAAQCANAPEGPAPSAQVAPSPGAFPPFGPSQQAPRSNPCHLARSLPAETDPTIRHATPDATDAELRYWASRAEESLTKLKSALEERDAWQAMAKARLLPKPSATMSWWTWLRSTGSSFGL